MKMVEAKAEAERRWGKLGFAVVAPKASSMNRFRVGRTVIVGDKIYDETIAVGATWDEAFARAGRKK